VGQESLAAALLVRHFLSPNRPIRRRLAQDRRVDPNGASATSDALGVRRTLDQGFVAAKNENLHRIIVSSLAADHSSKPTPRSVTVATLPFDHHVLR